MHDDFIEKTGCFVYLILQPVRPRPKPSGSSAAPDCPAGADSGHNHPSSSFRFLPGQLVSVDAVRQGESCSYLRLSDGSGWIPNIIKVRQPAESLVTTGGGSSSKKNHPLPMKVITTTTTTTTTPLLTVQEIPVERGVWSFYVDNAPVGQALRRHPVDSIDPAIMMNDGSNRSIVYESMQKIYCDRRVVHPQTRISFYKVQATNGWVFDKRIVNDGGGGGCRGSPDNVRTMLIEVSKVKTGLFCFQALCDMVVRRSCTTSIDAATDVRVSKGQTVAVDIVRSSCDSPGSTDSGNDDSDDDSESESSDDGGGDGPFLRLTDGSGWLYTHMDGVEMMKEIPVCRGIWELKVLNPPVGVSLRRHPLDCEGKIYNKIYQTNSYIQADYLVRTDGGNDRDGDGADDGTIFYRVKGTTGWVFDRRGDQQMLELLTDHDSATNACLGTNMSFSSRNGHAGGTKSTTNAWTAEFVRGVAATIDNVFETEYNASDQVLTFETNDDILFVVYCRTRTIGIRPSGQHFTWFRKCKPKELWEHMKKDLVELMMSGCKSPSSSSRNILDTPRACNSRNKNSMASPEKEEEIRNELLQLDEQVEAIQQKRGALLKKIHAFDRERMGAAKAMKKQVLRHAEETGCSTPRNSEEVTIIQEADDEIETLSLNFHTTYTEGKDTVIQPVSSTDPSSGRDTVDDGYDSSLFASMTIPDDEGSEFSDDDAEPRIDLLDAPRRLRLEAVKNKRMEVRQRIQQLLELKSQETLELEGAFSNGDGLTALEDNDEEEGFEAEEYGTVGGRTTTEVDTLGETIGYTIGADTSLFDGSGSETFDFTM